MLADHDREFTDFFDSMLPRILRIAYAMISDYAEAEDIAAEALAWAYGSWPRLRLLPYRDRWVLRTAIHLSIDLLRHRSAPAHPRRSLSTTAESEPMAGSRGASPGSPGSVAELVTDRRLLVGAAGRLPKRQREAVVLRYLADLPVKEVAELMDCGEESVRTHLTRGIGRLRLNLGPDVEEDLDGHS